MLGENARNAPLQAKTAAEGELHQATLVAAGAQSGPAELELARLMATELTEHALEGPLPPRA